MVTSFIASTVLSIEVISSTPPSKPDSIAKSINSWLSIPKKNLEIFLVSSKDSKNSNVKLSPTIIASIFLYKYN